MIVATVICTVTLPIHILVKNKNDTRKETTNTGKRYLENGKKNSPATSWTKD